MYFNMYSSLTEFLARIIATIHLGALSIGQGLQRRLRDERGDVPGWVLVTLMTAGLVTAIWLLANDQLAAIFKRAVRTVKAP